MVIFNFLKGEIKIKHWFWKAALITAGINFIYYSFILFLYILGFMLGIIEIINGG